MVKFIKTAMTVTKTLSEAITLKAFFAFFAEGEAERQDVGNQLLWSFCLSLGLKTEVLVKALQQDIWD